VQPIQILVAVVHASIAKAIQLALEREQGLRVVGHVGTVQELLSLVQKHAPNVLLLDPDLGDGDGFELICTLRDQYPQIRVVVFTGAYSEEVVLWSLNAGAWGCLSKDEQFAVLLKAIRAVSQGEIWAPRRLLSQAFVERPVGKLCQEGSTQSLTAREQEICHHVAQGETNKEIASRLFITEKTVKSHLHRIFHKLHVHHRVDVAMLQAGNRTHSKLSARH
jgi:DNA-binding NarL/FixJ family response regulator